MPIASGPSPAHYGHHNNGHLPELLVKLPKLVVPRDEQIAVLDHFDFFEGLPHEVGANGLFSFNSSIIEQKLTFS